MDNLQEIVALWDKYHQTIAVDAMEYDRELRQLLGTNLAEVGTDCISRQAVIDAIGEKSDEIFKTKQKGATYPHDDFFQGMAYAENVVRQLPSAQPEIIYCGDCKYKDDEIDEDGTPFLKCLHGRSYGGTRINDFCSWAEKKEVTI